MKIGMNSRQAALLALCCSFTFAGHAWGETTAKLAAKLARYEAHAGPPIAEVRNYRLYRWQPLGKQELAIWSNPRDVYLVRVHGPCNGLDFAKTIGTTTQGSVRTLNARFDSVVFEDQRCVIRTIQPVDYDAVRAEERAAREARRRD